MINAHGIVLEHAILLPQKIFQIFIRFPICQMPKPVIFAKFFIFSEREIILFGHETEATDFAKTLLRCSDVWLLQKQGCRRLLDDPLFGVFVVHRWYFLGKIVVTSGSFRSTFGYLKVPDQTTDGVKTKTILR